MRKTVQKLWETGEYDYPEAYGFVPNLHGYLHEEREKRPAVIVVPGGGYAFVSPSEGEMVAEEFYRRGYQAFVCVYTVNPLGRKPLMLQPAKDLARAIRYVRKNAASLGAEENKVAFCGFSAGGHLCGTLCVHFEDFGEENPAYQPFSCRPDAAVLSYPVISMGEMAHKGSVRKLLGDKPSKEELHYMSLEKNVTDKIPPCFLWHTITDGSVPVENSLYFMEACRKQGVPVTLHLFAEGVHGLSLSNERWARGEVGSVYPLEQVGKCCETVWKQTGELSEELQDLWKKSKGDYSSAVGKKPNREAAVWVELADLWLKECLGGQR